MSGPRRSGLDPLGLLVSSGPVGPFGPTLLYRPLTVGVPGRAWKGGSPFRFWAKG